MAEVRLHSFFSPLHGFQPSDEDWRYLKVRRIGEGEKVRLLNFLGESGWAIVRKNSLSIEQVTPARENTEASGMKVSWVLANPDRPAQEEAARWCGVFGANSLAFFKSLNAQPHRINIDRLTKIMAEGQKQSGTVAVINPIEQFQSQSELGLDHHGGTQEIWLDPRGESLRGLPVGHDLRVVVGPPGGFQSSELPTKGVYRCLAPILRTEDIIPWFMGFLTSHQTSANIN